MPKRSASATPRAKDVSPKPERVLPAVSSGEQKQFGFFTTLFSFLSKVASGGKGYAVGSLPTSDLHYVQLCASCHECASRELFGLRPESQFAACVRSKHTPRPCQSFASHSSRILLVNTLYLTTQMRLPFCSSGSLWTRGLTSASRGCIYILLSKREARRLRRRRWLLFGANMAAQIRVG